MSLYSSNIHAILQVSRLSLEMMTELSFSLEAAAVFDIENAPGRGRSKLASVPPSIMTVHRTGG